MGEVEFNKDFTREPSYPFFLKLESHWDVGTEQFHWFGDASIPPHIRR
jgi:hypothetical protein